MDVSPTVIRSCNSRLNTHLTTIVGLLVPDMANERVLRNRNIPETVPNRKPRTNSASLSNQKTRHTPTATKTATNLNRPSLHRSSLGDKKSITPAAGVAANRISSTNSRSLTPAIQNGAASVDLNSFEDRLKSIEDNIIQKTRLSAVEAELLQLKDSNRELQLTVELLRSDLDTLQFISTQLCDSEAKISDLEVHCSRLSIENEGLKKTVAELTSRVDQIKSTTSPDNGVSREQQELNTNVVIRGVEIRENAEESELLAVYDKICAHLGVADDPDNKPISAKVLTSVNKGNTTSTKPIQIKLRSSSVKRQFLQARRIKRNILPCDIGIVQQSKRPLLITEELTRNNQELLYQARSLRPKFKFVWSNNGQILAREKNKSKVIRIINIDHVNSIKAELPQSYQDGRCSITEPEPNDQRFTEA